MISLLKLCANFLLLFSLAAHALNYLEFPAEKNNLQPLPQKFEFSLRDSSKLLLGNKIIETALFGFQIERTKTGYNLNLRWPPNVVEKGKISLQNPSRVAIWSENIQGQQGEYKLSNATNILQKLSGLSFFRFCVGHHEMKTGIEACSPEMTILGSGSEIRVDARALNEQTLIQINGRKVTPHGIVFLNDVKESLNFVAQLANGAEFRMDTRRIHLEFMDVIEADEKHLILTVKGSTPLPPAQYKQIDSQRWSIALSKERPLFYVPGEGRVPLRQEFIVQGSLPTQSHRLILDRQVLERTYSTSLELRGHVAKKGRPQTLDGSSVEIEEGQFRWSLKGIPLHRQKQNYIQIVDESEAYTAVYSVSREEDKRLEIFLGVNSDDTHYYMGAEAQLWFEKLISAQRLGLGLLYNKDLTGDAKVSLMEADLFFRLVPGIQFSDPSLILGVGVQNWSFDAINVQTYSPLIGWYSPSNILQNFFDWQEVDFKYTLPKRTSSLDLKSLMQVRWKMYHRLNQEQSFRVSGTVYTQDTGSQSSGILLDAAFVTVF